MSDHERDITALLEAEAERAPRPQGLRRATVRRGMRARAAVMALPLLVVASVAWVVVANPSADNASTDLAGPGPSEAQRDVLYEVISEQTRAEIFAFRALANNDLMDPFGARSYNWTSDEDTTKTEGSWRVGFAASDCAPKENSHTCTGLSGDSELGNALTDTYLHVTLNEERWEVRAVEGNMLPDEKESVVGYSLPDEREPSHWDFASVGLRGNSRSPSMTPIWVGPYPTEASGSVCKVFGIDADGERVGEPSLFYQGPPQRPFERGGWVRSGGLQVPPEAVDAVVECEQYTGEGWEVVGEPRLVGPPGEVMGVSIELEWRGPEEFIATASCEATLVDANGDVVWKGSESLVGVRPPGNNAFPYKSALFVHTGGEPVVADEVGEVICRTL